MTTLVRLDVLQTLVLEEFSTGLPVSFIIKKKLIMLPYITLAVRCDLTWVDQSCDASCISHILFIRPMTG